MVCLLSSQGVVQRPRQKILLLFFTLLFLGGLNAWGTTAQAAASPTENANLSVGWYALNNSDGITPQYAWKQSAGPIVTLGGANTNVVTFQPPKVMVDTPLSFELTVTNNNQITAKRAVTVMVTSINLPPIANAGSAQSVNENIAVTLDGSGSKDSDGTITAYAWKQTAGSSVTLSGATTAKPTFTAPTVTADTPLTFELTVTDNNGATAKSTVVITVKNVNAPPIANAGSAQTVNENSPVTLDGSGSKDSDGTITAYAWKQTAGSSVTLNGATTAKPTFTAPSVTVDTPLTFELTVTDNNGATAKSTVTITVKNVNAPPTANAQSLKGNQDTVLSITLVGTDADKDTLAYAITTQPSNGKLSALNGNKLTYTPKLNFFGVDSFQFKVNDGKVDSAPATVNIEVKASTPAPAITSITPLTGKVGQSVTLSVSGSNLPATIVATIAAQKVGCTTATKSATAATFTCPLDVVGSQALTVRTNTTANGGTLISGGSATFVVSSASSTLGTLNDTGITTCSDVTTNGLPCPVAGFPAQDGEFGRDKSANDNSDGHAGFSFTKISSTGAALPASATSWSCVKDNVTGLMWEVKTDDGGLHDKDWGYSWYEPDGTKNGGNAGTQNGGACGGTSSCDTQGFVHAVNTAGWCGAKDWRLPTVWELESMVSYDRTAPAIDADYFPNTNSHWYWSSSPAAADGSSAWLVFFYDGKDINYVKDYGGSNVRLVRGGQ